MPLLVLVVLVPLVAIALMPLILGAGLGFIGLMLTRWELTPAALYYRIGSTAPHPRTAGRRVAREMSASEGAR